MTEKENGQEEYLNPKGHPPLELEWREGHYWFPDGSMLDPDFPIGPEPYHKELFVEYERSFGRGIANYITHSPRFGPKVLHSSRLYPYGGHQLLDDYDECRRVIAQTTLSGNENEVRALIEKIREFRRKYPKLYDDAKTEEKSKDF